MSPYKKQKEIRERRLKCRDLQTESDWPWNSPQPAENLSKKPHKLKANSLERILLKQRSSLTWQTLYFVHVQQHTQKEKATFTICTVFKDDKRKRLQDKDAAAAI